MAGDWIKLQKDTPDKPEVLAIASRLGLDPDAVVGKLVRIWSWFDTHTVNGNASCVTFSFLDRITGVTGFAEQVALIGWLEQDGHDLRLPNFDYHNGETAKQRALSKNRVEKARSYADSNAPRVTKSLPEKRREEKRREDSNTVETTRGSRLSNHFEPDFDFAKEQGIQDCKTEFDKFKDYWMAQGGQRGTKLDWQATWRNWCRSAKKTPQQTGETAYQRTQREKMQAWAPGIAAKPPGFIEPFTLEAENVPFIESN